MHYTFYFTQEVAAMAPRIAVIIGSTRPGRRGGEIAQWVLEGARNRTDAEFEIVDLADFHLPLLDEAAPAAHGPDRYEHEHTKVWAEQVAGVRRVHLRGPGVQPLVPRCAEERDRLPLQRVAQQVGRLRQLRHRRRRLTSDRAAAAGHGGDAGRGRARRCRALAHGRLHRWWPCAARSPGAPTRDDVRPGRRVGRRRSSRCASRRRLRPRPRRRSRCP